MLTSAGKAEIIRTVGIVANGGLSFESAALIRLLGRVPKQERSGKPAEIDSILTNRERVILSLVGEGCSNEEIGQRLNLSKFTVRNNIAEIRSKLNVKTRSKLTAFAARLGLSDYP